MKKKEEKEENNEIEEIIKEEEDCKLKEIKNIIKDYLDLLQNKLLEFFIENENKIKGKEYCIVDKQILLNIFDYEIFNNIIFVMVKYLKILNDKYCTNKKIKKIKDFISFLKTIKDEKNDEYIFKELIYL